MNKTRVLIVDDEPIVLVAWEEELKDAGYDVWTASRGKKAIEIVKKVKPDIVITDLVMPEMNGVEVCRNIKEICPDSDVILVSGNPNELERLLMDFIKAGGRDELLRKPLIKDELIDVVRKISDEKR